MKRMSCLPRLLYIMATMAFYVVAAAGFASVPIRQEPVRASPVRIGMTNGVENGEPTMHTALCIIPPEEAWDTIQRARHLARDTTYRKWPPAIRLFHPFCPRARVEDAALEVANLVEKYRIRPFKVVLNSFAIVPQLEAIEADLEMIRSLTAQQQLSGDDNRSEDEKDFQQLIQTEEQIGRQRFERRKKQNA